jgi:hypothetical protein
MTLVILRSAGDSALGSAAFRSRKSPGAMTGARPTTARVLLGSAIGPMGSRKSCTIPCLKTRKAGLLCPINVLTGANEAVQNKFSFPEQPACEP